MSCTKVFLSILLLLSLSYHQPYSFLCIYSILSSYFTNRILWKCAMMPKRKRWRPTLPLSPHYIGSFAESHALTQYNCIKRDIVFLLVLLQFSFLSYRAKKTINFFKTSHTKASYSSMLYRGKYRLSSLFSFLLKMSRINVDTLFAFK